ncbi:MAG: hypothetical protein SPI50_19170, partial [Escherichia coli]|nr:hypothetical protein [Escherichia coli]MDY6110523.1 hypothetical protein [Escherichia coli]
MNMMISYQELVRTFLRINISCITMLMQSEHFRRYAFLLCPQYQVSRMESSRSPFLTPDIPPNLFCTAYIMLNN